MLCLGTVNIHPSNTSVQLYANNTAAMVTWNPVTHEATMGYFIYRVTLTPLSGSERTRQLLIPHNQTSLNITNLNPHVTYTVTVSIIVMQEAGLSYGPDSPTVFTGTLYAVHKTSL